MLMVFSVRSSFADSAYLSSQLIKTDSVIAQIPDTFSLKTDSVACNSICVDKERPSKDQKKKKLISAILAFPFPFGFMGAHRVMLGCKPWVPVVYVVTFGGCFGILPLIDFCAIMSKKDVTQYENNPNVFMWAK